MRTQPLVFCLFSAVQSRSDSQPAGISRISGHIQHPCNIIRRKWDAPIGIRLSIPPVRPGQPNADARAFNDPAPGAAAG